MGGGNADEAMTFSIAQDLRNVFKSDKKLLAKCTGQYR